MLKYYHTNKDGSATVSFYEHDIFRKLDFDDMFEMSDSLQRQVGVNYPGIKGKDMAFFDPESEGFMVYCATEEIAEVVNEELNELIFCELGKYSV